MLKAISDLMVNPFQRWAKNALPKEALLNLNEGFQMIVVPNDQDSRRIIDQKGWEPKSTAVLKKLVKPGDTFVDCGAHQGYYSLLASRLVGSRGRVFGFEPNGNAVSALCYNLALNDVHNVHILPIALWDKNCMLEYRPEGQLTGKIIDELKPWSRGITVTATYLDAMFEPDEVDFLKIDCEGSDSVIVQGATKIIMNGHARLMIENPPTSLLQSWGYKLTNRFPESEEQTWFFEK